MERAVKANPPILTPPLFFSKVLLETPFRWIGFEWAFFFFFLLEEMPGGPLLWYGTASDDDDDAGYGII